MSASVAARADPLDATIYRATRTLNAARVVETTQGAPTVYALGALPPHGHMWSIQPLRTSCGSAAQLTVIRGLAWIELPELLRELRSIDLFIHRGEHRKRNMLSEYKHAWNHLRPGGILISGGVGANDAWDTFFAVRDARPVVCPADRGLFGVALKL